MTVSSEELFWAMLLQTLWKLTMVVIILLCIIVKWPAVVLPEV